MPQQAKTSQLLLEKGGFQETTLGKKEPSFACLNVFTTVHIALGQVIASGRKRASNCERLSKLVLAAAVTRETPEYFETQNYLFL